MITVTVDSEKEFMYIQQMLEAGSLNYAYPNIIEYLGIPLRQTVHFVKGENYVDDLKDAQEAFNKRFEGMTSYEIEEFLRNKKKKDTMRKAKELADAVGDPE